MKSKVIYLLMCTRHSKKLGVMVKDPISKVNNRVDFDFSFKVTLVWVELDRTYHL